MFDTAPLGRDPARRNTIATLLAHLGDALLGQEPINRVITLPRGGPGGDRLGRSRRTRSPLCLDSGSTPAEELGSIPGSWLVYAVLPQVTLLQSAVLAVSHGGNNSVTELLTASVPLLLLPLSTDQFAGAAAVEKAGFGEALDPNHASPTELRAAAARLLDLPLPAGRELTALAGRLTAVPGALRARVALQDSDRAPAAHPGGTLCTDGLGTLISGVFNTFPYTSFSQNVRLVGVTGVWSRFVCVAGGAILLVLGLVPKMGALVESLPSAVLGGAGIAMFGMVAATGIRILSGMDFAANRNNLLVVRRDRVVSERGDGDDEGRGAPRRPQ